MRIGRTDCYRRLTKSELTRKCTLGVSCPQCGSRETTIQYKRAFGLEVQRGRACLVCTWHFTTYEREAAVETPQAEALLHMKELTRWLDKLSIAVRKSQMTLARKP